MIQKSQRVSQEDSDRAFDVGKVSYETALLWRRWSEHQIRVIPFYSVLDCNNFLINTVETFNLHHKFTFMNTKNRLILLDEKDIRYRFMAMHRVKDYRHFKNSVYLRKWLLKVTQAHITRCSTLILLHWWTHKYHPSMVFLRHQCALHIQSAVISFWNIYVLLLRYIRIVASYLFTNTKMAMWLTHCSRWFK